MQIMKPLRDMRFSQSYCWRLKSSGMSRHVAWTEQSWRLTITILRNVDHYLTVRHGMKCQDIWNCIINVAYINSLYLKTVRLKFLNWDFKRIWILWVSPVPADGKRQHLEISIRYVVVRRRSFFFRVSLLCAVAGRYIDVRYDTNSLVW